VCSTPGPTHLLENIFHWWARDVKNTRGAITVKPTWAEPIEPALSSWFVRVVLRESSEAVFLE